MKFITKIALVALIVGFPLASWYYLNTGLEFRKQALKELQAKGNWDIDGLDPLDFEYKTSVVFMDASLHDEMMLIHEQYGESNTFQIVEVLENEIQDEAWKTVRIDSGSPSIDSLRSSIFLVDTKGQLRLTYGKNKEDLKKLVEHIAIVLPREVEPDIKMRPNERK